MSIKVLHIEELDKGLKLTEDEGTKLGVAIDPTLTNVTLSLTEEGLTAEVNLQNLDLIQGIWSALKELPDFKQQLFEMLKGEEVQNFGGASKGYLLKTDSQQ